jgi:hypothetical protein
MQGSSLLQLARPSLAQGIHHRGGGGRGGTSAMAHFEYFDVARRVAARYDTRIAEIDNIRVVYITSGVNPSDSELHGRPRR